MASICLTVTGRVIHSLWLVAQVPALRFPPQVEPLLAFMFLVVVYGRSYLRVAAGRFLFFLVTILISRALHARLRLASPFVWNCDLCSAAGRISEDYPCPARRSTCLSSYAFSMHSSFCYSYLAETLLPKVARCSRPSLRYIIQTMDPTVPIASCFVLNHRKAYL